MLREELERTHSGAQPIGKQPIQINGGLGLASLSNTNVHQSSLSQVTADHMDLALSICPLVSQSMPAHDIVIWGHSEARGCPN